MEKYMPDRLMEVKKYKKVWWIKMMWDDGGVSDERLKKWLAPEHETIIREWIDGGGGNIPSTWCGYKLAEERKQKGIKQEEPEEEEEDDDGDDDAEESEEEEEDDDDEDEEFKPESEEEEVKVLKKKDLRRNQVDEEESEEEEEDDDDEDEEFKPESEEEEVEVRSKKRKRRVPNKKEQRPNTNKVTKEGVVVGGEGGGGGGWVGGGGGGYPKVQGTAEFILFRLIIKNFDQRIHTILNRLMKNFSGSS
jgi:hypothetical protein